MKTQHVELGYFAHPEAGEELDPAAGSGAPCPASVPGVVLVHDVWGLADHYRDLARRLASAGFGVLSLDLYREHPPAKIDDPSRWMQGLSDPAIQRDIESAVAFLMAATATRGRKVAVVGFCMGGMYALLAGCGAQGVSAAVCFYGLLSHDHGLLHSAEGLDPARKPRSPLDAAAALQCPLLGFFGDEDPLVPIADVQELARRVAATRQPVELVRYPEAGHAFMNDTREDAYRPEAARDAWQRMLGFLRQRLA